MPHILIDRKEREAGDRLTGFRDKRTAGRWVPEGHVSAPIGRVPLAAVMFPFFVQGVLLVLGAMSGVIGLWGYVGIVPVVTGSQQVVPAFRSLEARHGMPCHPRKSSYNIAHHIAPKVIDNLRARA